MGTLSNSTKVGSKDKNLVLQTLSKVYIQIGNRFYELKASDTSEDTSTDTDNLTNNSVIFLSSNLDLISDNYPGENNLIILDDGKLYKTKNGNYLPISISIEPEFNESLIINSDKNAPLIINSSTLVNNLNAQYLNGYSSDDFLKNIDNATIIGNWSFDKLTINNLIGINPNYSLDLRNGILNIDTINVNKLNINNIDDNENSENVDESNNWLNNQSNIINIPTYITSGLIINKSTKFNKSSNYSYNDISNNWISYNENSTVGGYSIIDLIKYAWDNGFLNTVVDDTTVTLAYYANLLTTSSKGSDLSDEDFDESEEPVIYKTYTYTPKDRSIYSTIPYNNTKFCDSEIYDKWFNKETMLKPEYTGYTYECICNTSINAGIELTGSNKYGTIKALVVGCHENIIRLITTGEDCNYKYMEEDFNGTASDLIKECEEEQLNLIGKEISAPILDNDILIEANPKNIIGDISNVNNSVFGKLLGYGISSEGNCYLVDAKIANSNIQGSVLENCELINCTGGGSDGFLIPGDTPDTPKLELNQNGLKIGPYYLSKNNESIPWLYYDATSNQSSISTELYNFNSSGEVSLGKDNIIVHNDGTITIGKEDYAIWIYNDGRVRIPQKCII